jgi:hypothetical protein
MMPNYKILFHLELISLFKLFLFAYEPKIAQIIKANDALSGFCLKERRRNKAK